MASTRLAGGRTALWGVVDQVLSALSNAAMTFVAANLLGATQFGVYALLFTAVTMLIGISRSLTTEVFTVLMSDAAEADRRLRQSECLGASAVLGLMVLLVSVPIGAAIGLPAVMAFGLASVFVLTQDSQRFLLVAERRVRSAVVNDLVWMVVQFAVLAVVVWWGLASISVLAFSWGIGAAVAVVVGSVQLGARPAITRARTWFRETRGYSSYYLAEFLAVAGSGYSVVYVVSLTVGVQAAGAYRGAQAIFGPVTSMVGGLRMVVLPAVVRLRRQGRSPVIKAAIAFSVSLLLASVAVTFVIWELRHWVAPLLLGATAAAAIPLIVPMGLGRAFASASIGLAVGFRALGATKRSLSTRVSIAIVTLTAAFVGAHTGGAVGAAWGFAIASAMGTIVWVWMLKGQKLVLGEFAVRAK